VTTGPADILLVEDNPDDVTLALHAFRKSRPEIVIQVVRDGADAMDYLLANGIYAGRDAHHVPKVVLLDLQMPKVDGFEVLRHLKADERTRAIPVVVLSSSRDHRDISACYDLGANSYLVKPGDFDEFIVAARALDAYWLSLNRSPSALPG
jgi:two-component system, response regulator